MNRGALDIDDTDRLHELIERQVDRTPDAVALSGPDLDLTYAELDAWANQLAHWLRAAGAGPETRVAVIAERCVDTVVALVAVLKAGACYVPVDPAYPPQRFHYLMTDSGADVLVVPDALRRAAPDGPWTTLSSDRSALAGQPTSRPDSGAVADNAAYVIYTSGSTGEPKGVVVAHRQIVASTRAMLLADRPEPASFLLLVSFSFDACGIGLYWTLATGGQVVVPTPDEHRDPRALRALAARHRVTHLDCTPALYSLILGDDGSMLASLRCAIVGGEACPRELVARHHALLPDCVLANNYGPTEATVWATTATLAPGPDDAPVPIGRPIAGTTANVLDDEGRPVADGEAGELYLGGAGVARGYHLRPGLTAERFLPDPYAARSGGRTYRTGDRVRRLRDGQLEFCGRVDHQVKIRGFRVELGEVEQALAGHPDVAEVVADVRLAGDASVLAVWIAPAAGRDVDAEDVRAFAADRLPAHLVPSWVTVVDALPRNVAGKVDRAQLAAAPAPASGPGRPMTPLEAEMAELMAGILGVESIGVADDVFALGCTSLHIAQLALGVWSRFGVTVPVHDLFELPHVAGFARCVAAARQQETVSDVERWDLDRLWAEGVLADDIKAGDLPPGDWRDPGAVLVTGATGYLGAFLVRELLARTSATVWCLVRAGSPEAALTRVRDTMRRYLIWDDDYATRLRAVPGDLARPRLGLDPDVYERLAGELDAIYHSGCLVNFLYPYRELKAPNVGGTEEVLRLATTTRLKAVHHVSSIDMFLQTGIPRPFIEDDELRPTNVPDGYCRSKWVSEHLVRLARERGVPCAIYRPGMMVSHTATGATQTTDYLLVQVKGLMEFGVLAEHDFMFDAITIDYAARAMVHISLGDGSIGRNFHLWNLEPVHIHEVHEWIRSFGYDMATVPLENLIQKLVTLSPDNPIFPLMPVLLDERGRGVPPAFQPEVIARTDFRAEMSNTLSALAGSGIDCPKMTEELAHRCFAYLVSIGDFPPPEQQRLLLSAAAAAYAG